MGNVEITISEPTPFFSQLDESNFFDWLQRTGAVESIERDQLGLRLALVCPLKEANLRDFIAVLMRYQVDMSPLRTLSSEDNKAWFEAPSAYWYESLLGNSPE